MELKVLKCPACGANIEYTENREFCFCSYCGCKIILENENQEIIIDKKVSIIKTQPNTM